MKSRFPPLAAAMMVALLGSFTTAIADDRGNKEDDFAARLSGYNEVHFVANVPALRGAVSTTAGGSFKAEINDRMGVIDYELTFEGLESDVTQAHIHFGQRHTVGGIVVWLCKTANVQPTDAAVSALTPFCGGPRSNTVTGTITPAQVIDVVGQGIAPGQFDELVRAIRAGATYANVHSATFGPGEIRGHINPKSGHGQHGH
jgi:CHRD domain-containing protein